MIGKIVPTFGLFVLTNRIQLVSYYIHTQTLVAEMEELYAWETSKLITLTHFIPVQ